MKLCNKCKKLKSEKEFSKHKGHKNGLQSQCKGCCKIYKEQYYKTHKKQMLAKGKKWRANNGEKENIRLKLWCKNNPERRAIICKKYRENNKEKIAMKNKQWSQSPAGRASQKRKREKVSSTPKGRLDSVMRATISYSLKLVGSSKNGCHWETLVGFTVEELKKHLESQFDSWMSWENYGYGKDKWCIDHKKPIISFNYDSSDHKEFKKCWALKNLQPMRCSENFSKCAKLNWKKAA